MLNKAMTEVDDDLRGLSSRKAPGFRRSTSDRWLTLGKLRQYAYLPYYSHARGATGGVAVLVRYGPVCWKLMTKLV